MQSCLFVEEPGRAIIDRKGVKITYSSGGEVFVRRMSIEDFRAFITSGQQLLNEYDAAQRCRVVSFPKGRKRGH